jgi:hypothetical protein
LYRKQSQAAHLLTVFVVVPRKVQQAVNQQHAQLITQ